ncbi:MAG: hypothetical protein QXT77_04625 [Candidatus Methanomethylicaceae archaeon]
MDLPKVGSVVCVKMERIARLLGARQALVVRIDKAKAPVYDNTGDLIEYQEKIYAIVLQPQGKRRLTYWGPKTFWDYFAPAQQQSHKTREKAPLLASVPSGVPRPGLSQAGQRTGADPV